MQQELSSTSILYFFAAINGLVIVSATAFKYIAASLDKKPQEYPKEMVYNLKNSVLELDRIMAIAHELERYRVPIEVVFDVNLILDEIFTNIITHAYSDRKEHIIQIRQKIEETRIIVEVHDDGREFNPLEAPAFDAGKTIEEMTLDGLGIHLIVHLADSLKYRRADGKNILTFEKSLEKNTEEKNTESKN
ncbi:MAG: ATP-binding protein [Nitrospirae bacterium]|nr:ATP-binding protein [Nitrospirota bacterium]